MITGLVLSIASYLAPFVPQSWTLAQLEPYRGLLRWFAYVPIVFIVLYVIRGLLKLNYDRYAASQASLEQMKRELEEIRRPKLEILYGIGGAFEHDFIDAEGVPCKLFRIAVRNVSTKTIHDVEVRLRRLRPLQVIPYQESSVYPIPLRRMHGGTVSGNVSSLQLQFSLHVDHEEYIDVVMKRDRGAEHGDEIVLCYAVENIPNGLSPRAYRMEIEAIGQDVPRESKWFHVDVNHEGRLAFFP